MLLDGRILEEGISNDWAFMKSIPNSVQYWSCRKKDLFAMIRQLGKPTFFLTLSANKIRWPHLLIILNKIRTDSNIDLEDPIRELSAAYRAALVTKTQ